jgi:hypothetical protein
VRHRRANAVTSISHHHDSGWEAVGPPKRMCSVCLLHPLLLLLSSTCSSPTCCCYCCVCLVQILNFSIAYGKTAHGLSKDWGVTLDEAEDTVKRWYADR